MNILATTINLESLTLGDWTAIAQFCGFKPQWAVNCWLQSTPSAVLGGFDLEAWEAIADEFGYGEGWAYYRYKEFRSKEAVNGKA